MKPGTYISFNPIYLNKFEIEKHNKTSIILLECFSKEFIKETNGYNVILLTEENIKFLPRYSNGEIDKSSFFQATHSQAVEYHVLREEYECADKIKNIKEWKQDSDLTILGNIVSGKDELIKKFKKA